MNQMPSLVSKTDSSYSQPTAAKPINRKIYLVEDVVKLVSSPRSYFAVNETQLIFCFAVCIDASTQVVTNGLTPAMALRACCHPCSRQMLYKKLRQMREENPSRGAPLLPVNISSETSTAVSSITHTSEVIDLRNATHGEQTWWDKYTGESPAASTIDSASSTLSRVTAKKSRRSSKEVNRTRRMNVVKKRECETKYKAVLKEACGRWSKSMEKQREIDLHSRYCTSEKSSSLNDISVESCQFIVGDINGKLSDEDKKITKTTVQRYVKKGVLCEYPLKPGPAQRIPLVLLNAVRLHIKMMQLARSKEATPQDIKAVMLASVKETRHEGSFNIEYAWRRVRELYPDEVVPSKMQTAENIRSDWTTFSKLNDWFDMNKPILVDSGHQKEHT